MRERAPWIDRGTVAGGFAASLVLLLWLFTALGARESQDPTVSGSESSPTTTSGIQDLPSGAVGVPVTPAVSPWEADPRWRQALDSGKAGLDQAVAAEEWREKKGGDPFYYRNQLAEATKKVEQAVTQLQALKSDFAADSTAVNAIDRWIKHYEARMPRIRK